MMACVALLPIGVIAFFFFLLIHFVFSPAASKYVSRQIHEPLARSGGVGFAREALSSRLLLESQGVQSVSRAGGRVRVGGE